MHWAASAAARRGVCRRDDTRGGSIQIALAHDKARWCTSVLETAPGTLKAQRKPGQWLPDYKVIAENKQKKRLSAHAAALSSPTT